MSTPTEHLMSPEAQRIAIAEACGWKEQPIGKLWKYRDEDRYAVCASHCPTCNQLPDYLADLNAMHGAEMSVLNVAPAQTNFDYAKNLGLVTGSGRHITTALICATAAQRAEAFLRTIGKWEDGQ